MGASGAISGIFREIMGALLAPFWYHVPVIFRIIFSLGFYIDFVWLLGGVLVDCCFIVGAHVGYFARLCEKRCTPRTDLIVNTDQIEGRAPVKASKKASRNEAKNGMKTKTNK